MLKHSQKVGFTFLFLSTFLGFNLPDSAQAATNCAEFIRPGRTLNWITIINGLPSNRGTLTISTLQPGRWSGRQVNQTSGGINIDVAGQFNGSTVIIGNPAYNETWKGQCTASGIGGQINNSPNFTFVMW